MLLFLSLSKPLLFVWLALSRDIEAAEEKERNEDAILSFKNSMRTYAPVRVMHLRVSDPEFQPLSNAWLGALASTAAYLPAGGGGRSGEVAWAGLVWSDLGVAAVGAGLVVASAVAYLFLFSALAAQITGCLNLPRNPFVLSREKYASEKKE